MVVAARALAELRLVSVFARIPPFPTAVGRHELHNCTVKVSPLADTYLAGLALGAWGFFSPIWSVLQQL